MGCDIHLHTEVKIDGVWHHHGAPDIPRNYTLFDKMAGVRKREGDIVSLKPHAGIPRDATGLTKIYFAKEKPDAHDVGWFDEQQIIELTVWWEKWYKEHNTTENCTNLYIESQVDYLFRNAWYKQTQNGVEDIRFIFWFDN